MTATVEVDLDSREAEVRDHIVRLEEAMQRLSLDALAEGEGDVAEELRDVEHQLGRATGELHRIRLARQERSRREHQAQVDEEAARRAAALAQARKLQREREKLAALVDASAKALATALARWDEAAGRQVVALREAGRPQQADQARSRPYMVEQAIQRALLDAQVPRGLIRLESFLGATPTLRPGSIRPLAECDARPVEGA